jgi:hypothetical protein
MKPMMLCIFVAFVVVGLAADAARAQQMWRTVPKIAVISPTGDSRLRAVDEAVAFWNRTLTEIGSGFRLGAVTRLARPIPEEAVQALGRSVLGSGGRAATFPPALSELPGDITIFLATSEFISFASPFNENSKRVIGIRAASSYPMFLANVPRNVIAHELGHAIGLRHNSDPAMLMCGRPATCRPDLFQSDQPRMFPLRDDERSFLLTMYPAQWKTR